MPVIVRPPPSNAAASAAERRRNRWLRRSSPAAVVVAILLLLLAPSAPPLVVVRAAYDQASESAYLTNFDATVATSYSAVDDSTVAPPELLAECKDRGLADSSVSPGGTLPEIVLTADDDPTATGSLPTTNNEVSASSASTQCGTASTCVVPPGVRLIMSSSLNVAALVVRGELYWRDVDQVGPTQFLCAGYVAVEDDGKFVMKLVDNDKVGSDGSGGSSQNTKEGWIYIKDNGLIHPIGRSRFFGAAVPPNSNSNSNPTVEITGRDMVRTWSLLDRPLRSGETSLRLLHSPVRMGWKVGDRIGVAPTVGHSAGWGQTFRIVGVSDDGTVGLDGDGASADLPDHSADFVPPPPTGSGGSGGAAAAAAALKAAEVVNLSRNVVLTGDDLSHVPCDPNLPESIPGEQTSVLGCRCASHRSQCTMGLHTAQMNGGTMRVRNVRVEKCGQRGVEGKYCLHFHRLGDCPDCLFEDNAVEFGHQRGIIVHGTHRSMVEGNVLWDVRGGGIYIEDGNEMHNRIKYNVVICPYPFNDPTHHGCTVPGTSNAESDSSLNQAGIYTVTAANDLVGNRVSNTFNGMLLQANGVGRGGAAGKVCTNHLEYGRWEGNTFHGHLRFGTYTLGGSTPRQTDQSVTANGYNLDQVATCAALDSQGSDRGSPTVILNNVDYGNVFVGHYTAADIQHRGHRSMDNNNLIYWKETKNFEDGCSSHITDGHYSNGNMALPDAQSTFIIQNTVFDGGVTLEANHHCNEGVTGFLCMPQYVLDNVRWRASGGWNSGRMVWLQRGGTGGGGVFTLSPPNAASVVSASPEEQEAMEDMMFPPGYVSLASSCYSYLVSHPDCDSSASLGLSYGTTYDNGILCKTPLRVLKIWSRGLDHAIAKDLLVEAWFDGSGAAGQSASNPAASQTVNFHAVAAKQGYSLPVIPTADVSYRLSLSDGGDIPADWIVEFSDPIMGNRWDEELVQLNVKGRDCGADGMVSSQHDRRYLGGLFIDDNAWGGHGACVTGQPQPPNMDPVDCSAAGGGGGGGGGGVGSVPDAESPDLCAAAPCSPSTSYCHCGTAQCECRPGFAGSDCSIDLCAAARCGEHGACAALYLGDSSALPVTSPVNACVCEGGWFGPLCDVPDPCISANHACGGRGRCASSGGVAYCDCDDGYSGENCEESCDAICSGAGGVWPYGCSTNHGGAVKYKCGPTGGCQYLGEGEEGHANWCVYMDDSQPTSACECPSDNDCDTVGPCNPDGTCPDPIQVADGTPCNSKPFGVCQGGACQEPQSSAPTHEPSRAPTAPIVQPTGVPSPKPVASPTPLTCDGICNGVGPYYSCAGPIAGKVTYKCSGTGCQYLGVGEEGHVDWCTYMTLAPEPTPPPVPAPTSSPPTEVPTPTEVPPVASPTLLTCDGICNGVGPYYSCAGPIAGKVTYKCSGTACQYLGVGEEGHVDWCTYMTLAPEPTPPPVPESTPPPVPAPTPSPPTEVPTPTEVPPVASPTPLTCDGICNGVGPYYSCAGPIADKVTYKCSGTGCQYLGVGEEGHVDWCTYMTLAPEPTPPPVPESTPPPVPAPTPSPPTEVPTPTEVPPVASPTPLTCDGICNGVGPYYSCAGPIAGKVTYKCSGTACQYLGVGEEGHVDWCTYMTLAPEPTPPPIPEPTPPPVPAPTPSPPTEVPTPTEVPPVASPTPLTCDGICNGVGPYYSCAGPIADKVTYKCSGTGCQYLGVGEEGHVDWCTYMTLAPEPTPPPVPESTPPPVPAPTPSPPTEVPTPTEVPPVASPTPLTCDGICNGVGPYYSCAGPIAGKVTYKCSGTGCQYLGVGEEGHVDWCTYMTLAPEPTPPPVPEPTPPPVPAPTPPPPTEMPTPTEVPPVASPTPLTCDGICNGVGPYYSCAGQIAGKVTYKCSGKGCQYLGVGEEGHSSWCTYMTLAPEPTPPCDGICHGSGPNYQCAGPIEGKVTYKCLGTGCQYLGEGEEGHADWCTYMTLAPAPSPTPPSSPAPTLPVSLDCIQTDIPFNAGYGTCDTYAPGAMNNPFCGLDSVNGIYAEVACSECGKCNGEPYIAQPPVASPSQFSCDGICHGSGPNYQCAGPIEGKVTYKCFGTACQYLGEGEEGHADWCTYMSLAPQISCKEEMQPCSSSSDCCLDLVCHDNLTCGASLNIRRKRRL